MEKNKKEIITINTMKNKDYKMRQFSLLSNLIKYISYYKDIKLVLYVNTIYY